MKHPTISTWAKKNFIYWFLDNYLCSETSERILCYLLENKDSLSSLRIVDNGALFRPLLLISSEATGLPPCLLFIANRCLQNPMQIEKQIEKWNNSDLYLTLYFPGRSECQSFQNICEEVILEIEPEKARSALFDFELQLMLTAAEKEYRRKEILKEIDLVLARGDRSRFYRLVKELKKCD